jgi:multicomponent Na+:H+ antiporter subunit E
MIKQFLLNLLLSLVWVALTGHLNYTNFVFGFVLGFFVLWILAKNINQSEKDYFFRVPKIIMFIFYFFYDMFRANMEVTKEIITPKLHIKPGIVAYPLDVETDFEITMFSNMIALTPGTMVVSISEDRKTAYIHSLYLQDKAKFIDRMKNGLERKLLEILR